LSQEDIIMVCACPHCGKMLKVNDSFAGRQATCPKCKKPFVIPKAPLETANGHAAPKIVPPVIPARAVGSAPPPLVPRPSPDSQAAVHAPPIPPKVNVNQAGPKSVQAPPPLPAGFTAQKKPGPVGPPLPPKTGRKTKSQGPPAIPGSAGSVSGAAINRVIGSLVRALSVRKITFGFLVCIFLLIFWLVPSIILIGLAMSSGSKVLFAICCIISLALYLGLVGTFSGGIAYMGHMEQQQQMVGIAKALGFCGRKFISLFFGSVLFVVVILLIFLLTNGFAILLNKSTTVGSLLAAILFVPQLILNFALVLAFGVGVLAPCAIAVDKVGALDAISRLLTCVRRDTGQLMVHLAATILFSAVVMTVMYILLLLAIGPTTITNGPPILRSAVGAVIPFIGGSQGGMSSSFSDLERQLSNMSNFNRSSRTGRSSRPSRPGSPWGGKLRWFFIILVLILPCIYAGIYWILSFTAYYETARSRITTAGSLMSAGP